MVNYCVCWGCTNSSLSGHRVHRFPNRKNAALLRAWVRFVQLKRRDFNTASATKNAVVCGAHFKPEDYSPGDLMEFNMGCRSKQAVRLSPGAVPSISTTSPRPLLAAAPGPAAGERHGQGADRDSARHELRTPAAMSIEYTIDIQLTELGYPDILQSSVRETPCHSTSPHDSPSHTPTSLSPTPVQRLLARGQTPLPGKEAVKQTSDVEQATLPAPDTCTLPSPAPGPAPNEQVIKVTDDSGDSEVSDIYEEEEDDDDDDEEEDDEEGGLNNESSHSGGHRCSVCDLQLPSKFKLQDHMNLHTGARPYCCAECGKRFCQIYNYRVHLRTHAQTKVDRLHCRVCLISFKSQEELRAHLSKNHLEDEFYECDFCKRVFTSLKACEYHVQLHKCSRAVVCDVCGRSFSTPKSLARHQRVTCHRNFKCTDCTKVFTRKNALLKHSFTHLGLLPYTCIRCNCHFRLAKLYRKHKCQPERIHCVACLREFPSQRDFQQHKKDTGCWGNQEPKGDEIRCLECGQRFDTPEELKKHAGAHQRVLNCAECGKGFRSALLLMSHMGGHAGNSPCLCQSCGLGFPHQQNYDSHLKTCGQTPQPASAPKRRQASHISSTKTKKVDAKPNPSNLNSSNPNSSNPNSSNPNPANLTITAAVNNSAALVNGSSTSPGLVTGGVSADSAQSDGLWKLTLDAQPPPGVKLVVFLPVCPTQTDGQTHSPAISPAPQGPPQNVLLHLSNEHSRASLQDGPLNLVTGIKQDPDWEAPLDLSHKCSPALGNTSLPSIKAEPGEFEISSKADRTECKNSDAIKTEDDPMDTSRLIMDVKEEPQSPGPVTDPWSSTSCQLAEKEIKMEVDMSCPTEGK